MSLIDQCLCGARAFSVIERNDLLVAVCLCGVEHLQTEITAEAYEEQYRGEYHRSVDRHPCCVPYRQRYEHDKAVAAIRWRRYLEVLGGPLKNTANALDVGASCGAFVDYLRELDIDASGVDPDPSMARDGIITTGTTAELGGRFDLVTYHDVLEHTLEPRTELLHAARLCSPRGFVVVDVPDVSVEAGRHHYKAEHPWYFTLDALCRLMIDAGLDLLATDKPLPGKMVAYGRAP